MAIASSRKQHQQLIDLPSASLGARLFLPYPSSTSIGWVLRTGADFPARIKRCLKSWQCSLVEHGESDKPSTRAKTVYRNDLQSKTFEYVTMMLRPMLDHLKGTPLLASLAFHVMGNSDQLRNEVSSLLQCRKESGIVHRPLIVWEPFPPSCLPEKYEAFLAVLKMVDVFSPNHIELAQLFGATNGVLTPNQADYKTLVGEEALTKDVLENYALQIVRHGIGPSGEGALVLRAAERGCMVVSKRQDPCWLPAFYDSSSGESSAKIVDPTGAGNAFLGAFTIGYLEKGELIYAACYGNVGASFALEQVGVPELELRLGSTEHWNGADVQGRLSSYRARLQEQEVVARLRNLDTSSELI